MQVRQVIFDLESKTLYQTVTSKTKKQFAKATLRYTINAKKLPWNGRRSDEEYESATQFQLWSLWISPIIFLNFI